MLEGSKRSQALRNRRGAMLVFVAIAMVGLMGMLAMTIDVGAGNRQRRVAQTAVDAGALAGGTQILRGIKTGAAVTAAADTAIARNGFNPTDAVVYYPPVSAPHAGDSMYVEVFMQKDIPTIFGSIFNKDSLLVQARAVAGVAGVSTNCVVSLATTGTGLDLRGDLNASTCSVIANSSDANAISIANGKQIVADNVSAVGGINGSVSGNQTSGVPPAIDPLAYLPVDTGTTCTFTTVFNVPSDSNLNPGKYCGGIVIAKNATANLNPGNYYLRGGGMTGGHVTGTGVTIFNLNGPNNDAAKFAPFTFEQSCSFDLAAPLTGTYAGIAIYVDPQAPSSGAQSLNTFCGQGTITGTLYFPTQEFNLGNGNGKLNIVGAIIARVISEQNGGARLGVVAPSNSGQGPKRLTLVQ
jgi:hypothetical protein